MTASDRLRWGCADAGSSAHQASPETSADGESGRASRGPGPSLCRRTRHATSRRSHSTGPHACARVATIAGIGGPTSGGAGNRNQRITSRRLLTKSPSSRWHVSSMTPNGHVRRSAPLCPHATPRQSLWSSALCAGWHRSRQRPCSYAGRSRALEWSSLRRCVPRNGNSLRKIRHLRLPPKSEGSGPDPPHGVSGRCFPILWQRKC